MEGEYNEEIGSFTDCTQSLEQGAIFNLLEACATVSIFFGLLYFTKVECEEPAFPSPCLFDSVLCTRVCPEIA